MAPPKTNHKVSSNPLAFAELCYWLCEGEWTVEELVEKVGIGETALRKWLKYLMRPKRKVVRICERRVRGNVGQPKLIYTWGSEPDAPKIENKGDAVHSRNYRERKVLRSLYELGK